MTREQTAGFALGSALAFILSGLFYRVQRRVHQQINCINNAFVVTQETLPQLEEQIIKEPDRRLMIKFNGFIGSETPVTYPKLPNQPLVVWRAKRLAWKGSRPAELLDTTTSLADNVEIRLIPWKLQSGETDPKIPVLNVSPSIVKALRCHSTLSYQVEYNLERKWSNLASYMFMGIPWRVSTLVEGVKNDTHVFVTAEAYADSNGRITLIESPKFIDDFFISNKTEAQELNRLEDTATVCKGVAITSAIIGSVLAAVTAISARK